MIKFYFHASPNPMKVALMLEELGEKYEIMPVDSFKGEQHDPKFLAINPNGKVPVIDDGGTIVFDSNAILTHLALTRSQFLPTNKKARAEVLSWFFFVATGLSPFSGQAVHFLRAAPAGNDYAKNRYKKEAERHYKVMNDRLAKSPFLGGDEYSIADIAAWGWLNYAGYIFDDALAAYPKLQDYFNKISKRAAAKKALALREKIPFKQEFDEQTMRSLFPQNY
jgi:GSH-dependent disulfide-bond oxidoreductase